MMDLLYKRYQALSTKTIIDGLRAGAELCSDGDDFYIVQPTPTGQQVFTVWIGFAMPVVIINNLQFYRRPDDALSVRRYRDNGKLEDIEVRTELRDGGWAEKDFNERLE